jgi:hypothetical protein
MRYTVDGHIADEGGVLGAWGNDPPFYIHDATIQDWLPRRYRWRWIAQIVCWWLNSGE